jgi:luciferase family oxidoreductase group 1
VKTLDGIPLSVLDLCPSVSGADVRMSLRSTLGTARHVEQLGYTRYWLAEHHGAEMFLSSATALLVEAVAAATATIRVGSGGIMLPNHAPLVVAENFGTLESLHPGRIDLGVGRGVGGFDAVKALLRGDREDQPEDLGRQVTELLGYFEPDAGREREVRVGLAEGNRPPVWILGAGANGARLAGEMGFPFAYAYHFNTGELTPAMSTYRKSFRPRGQLDKPYAMVCAAVICADTDERAQWIAGPNARVRYKLAKKQGGVPVPTPQEAASLTYTPEEQGVMEAATAGNIAGSPETVQAALDRLLVDSEADELMVTTIVHDSADRLRSFELLARLAGLPAPSTAR